MSNEAWVGLIAAGVTLAVAVGPWMFSMHGKVAIIAHGMRGLEKLWERSDDHEQRIDALEQGKVKTAGVERFNHGA